MALVKPKACYPAGAQRGTELLVTITGSGLDAVTGILFYEPGLELVKLEETTSKKLKALIKIASDAPLGPSLYRLVGKDGLSDARIFSVSQYANYLEKENPKSKTKSYNNSPSNAEAVSKNITINGVTYAGDLDHYSFDLKKGEEISIEIEAMRLANRFFDPHLSLLNEKGELLAQNDDHVLVRQDSFLQYTAPKDGKYILLVRDSEYGGNNDAKYRVNLGHFPRPQVTYPVLIQKDKNVKLDYLIKKDHKLTKEVKINQLGRQKHYLNHVGMMSPSPNWLQVNTHQVSLESEPNDEKKQANRALGLPLNLNGRIEQSGDIDWWAVMLDAKQEIQLQVHARSLRSPLDAVLEVYNEKGKVVKRQDDSGGQDPKITFKTSYKGMYYIRIFDHLRRGGFSYSYGISVQKKQAKLSLELPPSRDRTQESQSINLSQMGRALCMMSVNRDGSSGKETIHVEGLPKGVTAKLIQCKAGLGQIPILFEASKDAVTKAYFIKPQIANEQKLEGEFHQTISLVNGANNKMFEHHHVDKLALAVLPKAPFSFTIESSPTALPRYGNKDLIIKLIRSEGFDSEVNFKLAYKTQGFSGIDQVKIPKGKSEVRYNLSLAGDAPLGKWPLIFVAKTTHKNLSYSLASEPHFVDVSEQYFSLKAGQCTAKHNQERDLKISLNQLRAFDQKAEVHLKGLPSGVSAERLHIDKAAKELIFKLNIGAKVRPGTYKDLYVSFAFESDKIKLNQNIRTGGTFRISAPKKQK